MVCGSITGDGMSGSKDDPNGISALGVKACSVLCLLCDGWFCGGCTGVRG